MVHGVIYINHDARGVRFSGGARSSLCAEFPESGSPTVSHDMLRGIRPVNLLAEMARLDLVPLPIFS